MNVEEKFDFRKFLKGFVSKKLIVWCIATVLLWLGKIDPWWWGMITMLYLGVNITQDFLVRKNGNGG